MSTSRMKKTEIAMKKKFSIKQGKIDKPLFISDPTIKRNICNNCGNPDHLYAGSRSPTPSTSSPKNDKNEQNKRVRKDPAYDDSSFSEEEQIENMLHTQRTLVQKVDQAISGLQGMIEGALQNFLGFATSSTTEQQFIPLEDNEEYLSTDNEEEADVESNIDA
ncbi:hypothetical protein RclHR1_24660004 [Rhizophagus clarus]|uniref:Uncharacterized protein n=1 Tax=Rhizophagus clarus TaxID=94130 RepID=A0A2Z6QZG9_9GLOM|nr:hypothetical protein RclHR1_24660004 [Rhizophagus clarus]